MGLIDQKIKMYEQKAQGAVSYYPPMYPTMAPPGAPPPEAYHARVHQFYQQQQAGAPYQADGNARENRGYRTDQRKDDRAPGPDRHQRSDRGHQSTPYSRNDNRQSDRHDNNGGKGSYSS